jgi:hypothetical protein
MTARPLRFRVGKRHSDGSTPGGYTETTRRVSAIRRASSRCARYSRAEHDASGVSVLAGRETGGVNGLNLSSRPNGPRRRGCALLARPHPLFLSGEASDPAPKFRWNLARKPR